MVGTHIGPASALHLGVENGYQLGNLHVCEKQSELEVINVLLHNLDFLKFINVASASY